MAHQLNIGDDRIMTKRLCTVPGCDHRHVAKGLCNMHRARMANYGALEPNYRASSRRKLDADKVRAIRENDALRHQQSARGAVRRRSCPYRADRSWQDMAASMSTSPCMTCLRSKLATPAAPRSGEYCQDVTHIVDHARAARSSWAVIGLLGLLLVMMHHVPPPPQPQWL